MVGKVADEPLVDGNHVLEQRPTRMEEQVEPRRSIVVEIHRCEGHFEELLRLKYEVFVAISDAGDLRIVPSEEHFPEA